MSQQRNDAGAVLERVRALVADGRIRFDLLPDGNYNHVGATLVDAVLQAGMPYATVVKPRVNRAIAMPNAAVASGFLSLLEDGTQEAVVRDLANNNRTKRATLVELTRLLVDNGVETPEQLQRWLKERASHGKLLQVKGVKNKSLDYLLCLVGLEAIAVDVHAYRFLKEAGTTVMPGEYARARGILSETAKTLGVSPCQFDYGIWDYMSRRGQGQP